MMNIKELFSKPKQMAQKTAVFITTMFLASFAAAATAPTSSATLGYIIYDLFFNKIYGSGGGYAAGVLMLFWAATKIKADWREAAYIAGGGTFVLGLPAFATALGSVVI